MSASAPQMSSRVRRKVLMVVWLLAMGYWLKVKGYWALSFEFLSRELLSYELTLRMATHFSSLISHCKSNAFA